MLQGYEDACPGAASRILEMAEREAVHRRDLETKALDAQIDGMKRQFHEARIGQLCAWSISICFLGIGSYVAIHGQPWVGGLFGTMGISGIVANFIHGRQDQDTPP
jgi:uncharacterized membrane protein